MVMRVTSDYDRVAHDWYVEPSWAVRGLIRHERFVGTIWDPACGGGTIPDTFNDLGYVAGGSDVMDRGRGLTFDFLNDPWPNQPHPDNIVCNPPYGQQEEFVMKSLTLARLKVVMLLRLSFLESGVRSPRRRYLLDVAPLARVWVSESRISMPPGGTDIPAKGGAHAFAWFVWDKDHMGPTTVGRFRKE